MDSHIHEYYQKSSGDGLHGNFHQTIALHQAPDTDWSIISQSVKALPRGWYELSQLTTSDRIEFIHDFWQTKLPYRDRFTQSIDKFFASLDDIGIYLTQKTFDDPYEVEMVYSLRGNQGFYRGKPSISENDLELLQKNFPEINFPSDYIAFLRIHDGFCKTTDTTGITRSSEMVNSYNSFQELIADRDPMITSDGNFVDPKSLVPFYESFGMPFYQCFWSEWYPDQEMGNVYYSAESHMISDVTIKGGSSSTMAFPTFVEWLAFYLERIE